jgi:hypothetical protein
MSSGRAFCFSGHRGVVNQNHDITMNTIASPVISRRQKAAGPDHHLWNNHGTWWFHGTFHLPDGTAERVRVNLKTADLTSARLRRDHILAGHCFRPTTHAKAA